VRVDERSRASDAVFVALRDAILAGELAQGSDHSIYEFAERFGVSRTPVREAVLRLADLGMVEVRRNRGVRIRGLSAEEVRGIFELRMLLEAPAAEAAARASSPELVATLRASLAAMRDAAAADDVAGFERADRAVHEGIVRTLDNERVTAIIASLRNATQAMGASTMNRARRLDEIEVEHEPIVDAIAAADPEVAAARMREHLERTARALLAQVDPSGSVVWRG
jgi:DNA-binding GntR family transcriptional regulator